MNEILDNDSCAESDEVEGGKGSWTGALAFFFHQVVWLLLGTLACRFLWAEISSQSKSSMGWIQDVVCFMVSLLIACCMLIDAGKDGARKWPTGIQRAFAARKTPAVTAPSWRFVAASLGLLFVSCLAIAYAPLMLYAICPSVISQNPWVPFVVVYLVWTSFFLMTMIGAYKRRSSRSGKPMPIGLALLGLIARLAFIFCICELAKMPVMIAFTDNSLSIGSSFLVIPIWAVMQIATVTALVLAARCRGDAGWTSQPRKQK